jgi:hypothetical protein
LADPGTVFEIYVGENSVEVVAVRGKVSFVHSATETKYGVLAGSPSILADQQQVSLDEGAVDPLKVPVRRGRFNPRSPGSMRTRYNDQIWKHISENKKQNLQDRLIPKKKCGGRLLAIEQGPITLKEITTNPGTMSSSQKD